MEAPVERVWEAHTRVDDSLIAWLDRLKARAEGRT